MFEITYKGLFIFITLAWPFYDRCSDVDDLILNTTGILIGTIIYFGIKRLTIELNSIVKGFS